MRNAPYVHLRLDLIIELCQTFPIDKKDIQNVRLRLDPVIQCTAKPTKLGVPSNSLYQLSTGLDKQFF